MRSNIAVKTPAPRTYEGAPAHRIDLEAQLRRSVMACMLWESEFYESGKTIGDRIAELALQLPLEVVAAIAIEAREKMYLRHAPLWLVRAMAPQGGKIVGDTLSRVIQRADEMAEFLALYWKDGKTPLSKQVKRGLAQAFTKFDAYQLAKYNRDGAIKLRDVLFLRHAEPLTVGQAVLWKQLVDGTLESPDTWEVQLSAGADKNAVWTHLLLDNMLGGLALLRNLRNMLQAGVDHALIREAINANAFKYVLPFRFIAAAKYAPDFEPELEAAMFRKVREMQRLPGRTVLLIDCSASMEQKLSEKSEMTRFDAAAGLAMILREITDEVFIYGFSTHLWKIPPRSGFALLAAVKERVVPAGTLLGRAKSVIDAELRSYDRFIVITDEQSADKPTPPLGKGYVINVASAQNGIGYGPWNHVDGWSENVLEYIRQADVSVL